MDWLYFLSLHPDAVQGQKLLKKLLSTFFILELFQTDFENIDGLCRVYFRVPRNFGPRKKEVVLLAYTTQMLVQIYNK